MNSNENNQNREKWVNETIESISGIKRAEASPFLYAKVLHRLKQGQSPAYISARKAFAGIAAIAAVVFLNIFILFGTSGSTVETENIQDSGELVPTQSNPYLEILSTSR